MVVVVVVATTQVATQVAQPPRLQPPPLRFKKYCAQVLCFVFCALCFVFSKIIPTSLMVVVVVVATTQVATQIARPPRLQPPPLSLGVYVRNGVNGFQKNHWPRLVQMAEVHWTAW